MQNATYFVQECPTCGRRLQIRVEYLGKRVACQHCQGIFVAADSSSMRGEPVDQGSALMRRANELLDSVAQRQLSGHPRAGR
ncbi:MAG: response regulator [Thermoguttaceae bacterium]